MKLQKKQTRLCLIEKVMVEAHFINQRHQLQRHNFSKKFPQLWDPVGHCMPNLPLLEKARAAAASLPPLPAPVLKTKILRRTISSLNSNTLQ